MRRIVVCAATRAELDACHRGILAHGEAGHEMLVTGVGPARAARSLDERLARGRLPDLVISSGFAGAVTPTLAVASWITGIRISEWNGVARVPVEGVDLVQGPDGLVRCDVLSSSALVVSSVLAAADEVPIVVDMESAALAREAGRRGVTFAVVRLISDTPAHPLPPFLAPFAAALAATTTAARVTFAGRALCAAAADPRGVIRLARGSTSWLRDLEAGWTRLAPWPLG